MTIPRTIILLIAACSTIAPAWAHQETGAIGFIDGEVRPSGFGYRLTGTMTGAGRWEADPMLRRHACTVDGYIAGDLNGGTMTGAGTCTPEDGVGPGRLFLSFSGTFDATLAFEFSGQMNDNDGRRGHDLDCDGRATPTDASLTRLTFQATCVIDTLTP